MARIAVRVSGGSECQALYHLSQIGVDWRHIVTNYSAFCSALIRRLT
jgi:hypothetical protein